LRLLGLEEAARWVSFSLAIIQLVKEIIALIVTIIEIITVFITAITIVTVVLAVVGALLQVLFTLLNIVASGIIAVVMFFIMVDLAKLNPTSSAYGYAEAAIWIDIKVALIQAVLTSLLGSLAMTLFGIVDAYLAIICLADPNIRENTTFKAGGRDVIGLCGGFSGVVKAAVTWSTYSNLHIVTSYDTERLKFLDFNPRPADLVDGFVVGNRLLVDLTLQNELELTDAGTRWATSWMAGMYH
jgi:hypothetical protein